MTKDSKILFEILRFWDSKDSIEDSRILGEIRDSKRDSRFQLRFHRERTRFQSVTNPSGVRERTRIETFKRRAGLGYRQTASAYY